MLAQPGEPSQFDVLLDGETLFSKERSGRFPEAGEILERLEGTAGA